MPRLSNASLLAAVCLLTVAAYALGLRGDFLFDDFPQIVLNKALLPLETYADLVRVWHSGSTGPGGRPLPVVTFALQVALTGYDPFPFKLVNLGIHLANGLLIYRLARSLVPAANDARPGAPRYATLFPLLVATWWLLSPMGLSTVLYVVQRMTSLAATFSLLALLWYIHFRRRDDGRGLAIAGVGLVALTACSFLSKEIGALTLVYVYLVEWFAFRFRSQSAVCSRVLAVLRYSPLAATALVGFWLWRIYDFELAYGYRPFTLAERVLTEARIVWFYIIQIFIPNVSWLTFYHDDFVLSTGLLSPLSTIFAVAGHLTLLALAAWLVRSAPLVSFGILWFYGGHLLESTIFPLELIFEHRNYLPMFGLYVAVLALPFHLRGLGENLKVFVVCVLLLIAGAAFATIIRATDWGSPMRVLIEAEHKPNSARANFDAAAKITAHLREVPTDLQAAAQSRRYYERAIAADPNHVAAFPGLIEVAMLTDTPLDEGTMAEFESRLATIKIHPAVVFTVAHLDRLAKTSTRHFDDEAAIRLYQILLTNASLMPEAKAHVLTAYGRAWGRLGNLEMKRDMLREALVETPQSFEIHLLYIESLLELGDLEGARTALDHLETLDKHGYYRAEAAGLRDVLRRVGQE